VGLHNLFEGLAIVAAYSTGGSELGANMTMAIAMHNVPEGIAVAEPLRRAGVPGWACVLLATLSGLGEPLGAVLGLAFLGPFFAPAMAMAAAGAMVVMAATELAPEAFSHGFVAEAAIGLLGGFLLAIALLA
jgi:ZIP family zinc transporter